MGTGALTIGAGNVDGAIFAMGESEMLIELYAYRYSHVSLYVIRRLLLSPYL